MDPEKSLNFNLFSLLNMESPKVQKVSHWLSKGIHDVVPLPSNSHHQVFVTFFVRHPEEGQPKEFL